MTTSASAELRIVVDESGEETLSYNESHALVIGVSDYNQGWSDLPGVNEDIEAVTRVLQLSGFQVRVVKDPDHRRLEMEILRFVRLRGKNEDNRLLIYFAGHGYSQKFGDEREMGYIVPADAPNPREKPVEFEIAALSMNRIKTFAETIESKHALFLFDSCFAGSIFSQSRSIPGIISYKTASPVRQFITSGSADEEVPDRSVFRRELIVGLHGAADVNNDAYVTGTELGEYLQSALIQTSGGQHPQYGKIDVAGLKEGDFVFEVIDRLGRPVKVSPRSATASTAAEGTQRPRSMAVDPTSTEPSRAQPRTVWTPEGTGQRDPSLPVNVTRLHPVEPKRPQSPSQRPAERPRPRNFIREIERIADLAPGRQADAVLEVAGAFRYADGGLDEIGMLAWALDYYGSRSHDNHFMRRARDARLRLLSALHAKRRPPSQRDGFVLIEAGSLIMKEAGVRGSERDVFLSPFRILDHEVTCNEFRRLVPTHPCEGDVPVSNVNWYEAYAYAAWLGGRLPTEAEWEYVARSGCGDRYCTEQADRVAVGEVAWWADNSRGRTHSVRQLQPNAWGVYDMFGNVREWVSDWLDRRALPSGQDPWGPASGRHRIYRGGGYPDVASVVNPSNRGWGLPYSRAEALGFRVVIPSNLR